MQTVTQKFLYELQQPVFQVRCRMDVLDTDELPISGGVFYDTSYTADSTNVLIDGGVDLDTTRTARRTFTATLLNNFGEWSPQSDWSGLFYVDRLLRFYRGFVYANGEEELVPIGTFFIDHADVQVERNMSLVVLSGTDKWKKVAKSLFTTPVTFAAGTSLNSVFISLLAGAGVTTYDLDPLAGRTTDQKTLNTKLNFEIKDSRGDALASLAKSYGLDMEFDPMGIFTTTELTNPATQPTVYTFTG